MVQNKKYMLFLYLLALYWIFSLENLVKLTHFSIIVWPKGMYCTYDVTSLLMHHGNCRGRRQMAPNYAADLRYYSKMVSKYSGKPGYTVKFEKPFNVTNNEYYPDPNIGYEQYWYNIQRWSAQEKCNRCPIIAQRNNMSCVTDKHEELYANVSMCRLLRQQCLGNRASGISTGIYEDFKDDYFVVTEGYAKIIVQQKSNLVVQLSQYPGTGFPKYTVILEAWQYCTVWRNDVWVTTVWLNNRPLNDPPDWTEFVMYWNMTAGWFLLTKSEPGSNNWGRGGHFRVTFTDPDFIPIKYIAVGSRWGWKGKWIIPDIVVLTMEPCTDVSISLAHHIPTMPVRLSTILWQVTEANRSYYSNIKHYSISPKNWWHTREEY